MPSSSEAVGQEPKDASGEEGGKAPEHHSNTRQAGRVKAWQGNGLEGTDSTPRTPDALGRPRRWVGAFPHHTHPRRLSPHPAAR